MVSFFTFTISIKKNVLKMNLFEKYYWGISVRLRLAI